MKKSYRTLMLVALVVLAFGGVLSAQDRDGDGQVRGTFVRLAERRVGDGGYLGIVVNPFDRDDHVTVLVPREHEELRRSARTMQEGDRLEISYAREHGEMWIKNIEVRRTRTEGDKGSEGGKRVEIRREVRRGPERSEERRESERRMESRQMRRPAERERMEVRREGERKTMMRREGRRESNRPQEDRRHREPSPHEQLERQLREVFTGHIHRLGMELKEVFGFHIERMQMEIRELRSHAENMRREVEELRAENERLRRQLSQTNEPRREGDREARERRAPDRRTGDRQGRETRRDGGPDGRRESDRRTDDRQGRE